MKCVDSSEILRLFAGQLSVERTELLQVHFERCAQCASRRDEIGTMAARIQHDPDEFEDPAAIDEVLALVRMGKVEPVETTARARSWWRAWQTWLVVPATAAATALFIILFWPPAATPGADGFMARGKVAIDLDRWVSLQVFRATDHGYMQVRDVVSIDDALAFAYLNRSVDQLRYLMVFGVDDRGDIFWYFPPNTIVDDNPASVLITGGAQPIELPEQVAHDLKPGPLRIFGIFSALPLTVQTIERELMQDLDAAQTVERLTRISMDDVGQYSLLLQVQGPLEQEPAR